MKFQTKNKINELTLFIKNETGFPFDYINFQKRNDLSIRYTYDLKNKSILVPYAINDIVLDDIELADYSILHEFGHVITDFILKTKININDFTKQEFEKNLKRYFNLNISVAEQQYNCFKSFINEFIHSQELVNVFRFDDACYINLNDIKTTFKNEIKQEKLPFNLYYNNSLELFSDFFASKMIIDKYTKDKADIDFEKLARKIFTHIEGVTINEDIKTKSSINQQVKIFLDNNKKIKTNPLDIIKIRKLANKDFSIANKELNVLIKKRIDIYNFIIEHYVTPSQEKLLNQKIKQFENQFQDAKKIYESMPKDKEFDIIADFVPPPNTQPILSMNTNVKNPLSQALWFQNEFKHNIFSKYAVIDPQNLKIYYFPTKPNNIKNDIGLDENIEKCIKVKTDEITIMHNNTQLSLINTTEFQQPTTYDER